jgi:hypothetical protein
MNKLCVVIHRQSCFLCLLFGGGSCKQSKQQQGKAIKATGTSMQSDKKKRVVVFESYYAFAEQHIYLTYVCYH